MYLSVRRRCEVPTYDYKCTKCGYAFAAEQSIMDEPLKRCPKCRGKLEKLLPQTLNLIFKGSGFYVTDYKKSGNRPAESVRKVSDKADVMPSKPDGKVSD
jgi:putative FmdB family regulatory protein